MVSGTFLPLWQGGCCGPHHRLGVTGMESEVVGSFPFNQPSVAHSCDESPIEEENGAGDNFGHWGGWLTAHGEERGRAYLLAPVQ